MLRLCWPTATLSRCKTRVAAIQIGLPAVRLPFEETSVLRNIIFFNSHILATRLLTPLALQRHRSAPGRLRLCLRPLAGRGGDAREACHWPGCGCLAGCLQRLPGCRSPAQAWKQGAAMRCCGREGVKITRQLWIGVDSLITRQLWIGAHPLLLYSRTLSSMLSTLSPRTSAAPPLKVGRRAHSTSCRCFRSALPSWLARSVVGLARLLASMQQAPNDAGSACRRCQLPDVAL